MLVLVSAGGGIQCDCNLHYLIILNGFPEGLIVFGSQVLYLMRFFW